MNEKWRSMSASDLATFLSWSQKGLSNKWMRGQEKYGPGFVGDPLDNAIEEALDLLIYLWKEKQRQGANTREKEVTRG